MAINPIGGGGAAPILNQVTQAAAPVTGGAAEANPTGEAIDANMMGEMGGQMAMQLGMEIQQEAQKIEQKNQQRAKEMLAEAKKDG